MIGMLNTIKSKLYRISLLLNPWYRKRASQIEQARMTATPFVGMMPGTGCKMYVTPTGYFSQHYLSGRPFEPELIDFIEQQVAPGMTVYDIGANIGYFTLLFARKVAPAGAVVAFEPGRYAFGQLTANLALNDCHGVTTFHCPLGKQDEEATYFEATTEGYDVYNSFTDVEIPQTCGADVTFEPRRVTVRALDILINEQQLPLPDFIKMDVEGYEMNVIAGMTSVLSSTRPLTIVFEFSAELGKKFGYSLTDFRTLFHSHDFSLSILTSAGPQPLTPADLSWPGGTLVAIRK